MEQQGLKEEQLERLLDRSGLVVRTENMSKTEVEEQDPIVGGGDNSNVRKHGM